MLLGGKHTSYGEQDWGRCAVSLWSGPVQIGCMVSDQVLRHPCSYSACGVGPSTGFTCPEEQQPCQSGGAFTPGTLSRLWLVGFHSPLKLWALTTATGGHLTGLHVARGSCSSAQGQVCNCGVWKGFFSWVRWAGTVGVLPAFVVSTCELMTLWR